MTPRRNVSLTGNSVFAVGQTNLTAFLQTTFGAAPALIPAIAASYSTGSPGIANGYDAISAVITDTTFQCVSHEFTLECALRRARNCILMSDSQQRCGPMQLRLLEYPLGATTSTPLFRTRRHTHNSAPTTLLRFHWCLALILSPILPLKRSRWLPICVVHGRASRRTL